MREGPEQRGARTCRLAPQCGEGPVWRLWPGPAENKACCEQSGGIGRGGQWASEVSGEGRGQRTVVAGPERGGSLSDPGVRTDSGVVIERGIMGR